MEQPLPEPEAPLEKEIRISARLSAQSRLSPQELERTIGEVQTAAEKEQARLSHRLPDSVVWYRRPAVAGLLVTVALLVWVVQLWVWKPAGRTPSARERDDGLRFRVALQAARIEDFRERTGRLPRTLSETDEAIDGMSYTVLDSGRYRLTIRDSTQVVTWRSDSLLSTFLGASLMHMREQKIK